MDALLLCTPRTLSPLTRSLSVRRQERIRRVQLKIFRRFPAQLLRKKEFSIDDRTEQQGESHFRIDSPFQSASFLTALDQVRKGQTRRLDRPVTPCHSEGLVPRSVAH